MSDCYIRYSPTGGASKVEQGEVRRIPQPVEKLLYGRFRAPFSDSTHRLCSILVVVSRRLDPIWRTDWFDRDFFNRLGCSPKLGRGFILPLLLFGSVSMLA
jgi:hypothetical protein